MNDKRFDWGEVSSAIGLAISLGGTATLAMGGCLVAVVLASALAKWLGVDL